MIDAHVHLWRLGQNGCAWPTPDLTAIYRDFGLDDLRGVARPGGVDQVILVQSQEDDSDTAWLLSIARNPLIAGVVGWVDLQADDVEATVARMLEQTDLAARAKAEMARDPEREAKVAALIAETAYSTARGSAAGTSKSA